jgi:hypothetical protein
MMRPMKRIDGFAEGQKPDEGWVVLKVKVRPEVAEALNLEAQRESDALNRRVFVSDLLRDSIRVFMVARRIEPANKRKGRFIPSNQSE